MARKERDPREALKSVAVVCQTLIELAITHKYVLSELSLDYAIIRTQVFDGSGLPNPKKAEFGSELSRRSNLRYDLEEKLGNLRLELLGVFLGLPEVREKLEKAWIKGSNSFGVRGKFYGEPGPENQYRLTGPIKDSIVGRFEDLIKRAYPTAPPP